MQMLVGPLNDAHGALDAWSYYCPLLLLANISFFKMKLFDLFNFGLHYGCPQNKIL